MHIHDYNHCDTCIAYSECDSFDFWQLKIPLNQFYPYIRCGLCCGFLIDASTITECLHTCKWWKRHLSESLKLSLCFNVFVPPWKKNPQWAYVMQSSFRHRFYKSKSQDFQNLSLWTLWNPAYMQKQESVLFDVMWVRLKLCCCEIEKIWQHFDAQNNENIQFICSVISCPVSMSCWNILKCFCFVFISIPVCKSCIVKHFFYSNRCPTCSIIVHETQPLYNIRYGW